MFNIFNIKNNIEYIYKIIQWNRVYIIDKKSFYNISRNRRD